REEEEKHMGAIDHRLLVFKADGQSKKWCLNGVPLEDFKALQGISGPQRFQIHKAYGAPERLPSAHTCELPSADVGQSAAMYCKSGIGIVRVRLNMSGPLPVNLPCLSSIMATITSIKCVLTQEHLDSVCIKYFVLEEVHSQLPGLDNTMHERPSGKVGTYTRFFDYSNYRIPFSNFFVSVLVHFRIPFSQLSVFGSAKVPILLKIKLPPSPAPRQAPSPPPPSEYNWEHVNTLIAQASPFLRFPEEFLCWVGISRNYLLKKDTYPQFEYETEQQMNTHHYGGRVSDTNARVRLQLRVGIVLVLGHRDELIHTAYMPESGGRGGGGKEEDLGGGYNTIGCHYLRNSTERDSSNRKRRELSLFSTGGGISSSLVLKEVVFIVVFDGERQRKIEECARSQLLKAKEESVVNQGLVSQVHELETSSARLHEQLDLYEGNMKRLEECLTDLEAYIPSAEVVFNSVVCDLHGLNFPFLQELSNKKDASTWDIMDLLRLDNSVAEALGMSDLQPDVNQLMVPVHYKQDRVLIGSQALSVALDIFRRRVEKMERNLVERLPFLKDVFVSLDHPLSAEALIEPPVVVPATNALSTVVIVPHSGPSVSVEDYENPDLVDVVPKNVTLGPEGEENIDASTGGDLAFSKLENEARDVVL
ncbi:gypsy type transposase, partial [Tanacetum coccineum]